MSARGVRMARELPRRPGGRPGRRAAAAVAAPRGPVCVLAGAGTGKTRTITRRIAHLVRTRPRRAGAGPRGDVHRARRRGDAHPAARARRVGACRRGPSTPRRCASCATSGRRWSATSRGSCWRASCGSSGRPRAGRGAGTGRRRSLRDLAGEIEWAKATLVTPGDYPAAVAAPAPRHPGARRAGRRRLRRLRGAQEPRRSCSTSTTCCCTPRPRSRSTAAVAEEFRDRYRCFVVDEYQDVTPLQQRVLDAWLGGRDDLTVVGDANQTIYSFAGATPRLPARLPPAVPGGRRGAAGRATTGPPRRSSPLANRVIGAARGRPAGTRLQLIGQLPPGPEPRVRRARRRARRGRGRRARRSGAGRRRHAGRGDRGAVPGQRPVRGLRAGAHRGRDPVPGARRRAVLLAAPRCGRRSTALRAAGPRARTREPLPDVGARRAGPLGLTDEPPGGAAQRAQWESLLALVELAEELRRRRTDGRPAPVLPPSSTPRADAAHPPTVQGVTLASLHAAKGLEWDAVFLVGLVDGTLPIQHAEGDDAGDRGGAPAALRRRHPGAAAAVAVVGAVAPTRWAVAAVGAAASCTG